LVLQGYALFFVLVTPLLFAPRYTRTADWYIGIGWYLLAKVCEFQDGAIYRATGGFVSGHTLKHLLGAVSTGWLLGMLMLRRPLLPLTPLAPPGRGVGGEGRNSAGALPSPPLHGGARGE
jgi:hypothetical protein